MAGEYGRGGIAKARSSSGGNESYDYAAKNAMSYFEKDEADAYQQASSQFTTEGVSSAKRDKARTNISRLREVAAMRAMKEWQEAGRFSADPSRRRRTQGLISSEMFGEEMFGNVSADQASNARSEISRLSEMAHDRTALGNTFSTTRGNLDRRLGLQHQYGNTFNMGEKGIVDFGTTYIADAERAYLGMSGGTNTVYRGGASREGVESRRLRKDVSHGGGSFHYYGRRNAEGVRAKVDETSGSTTGSYGRISHKNRSDFDF